MAVTNFALAGLTLNIAESMEQSEADCLDHPAPLKA
jgi:hypothetical protein